MKSLILSIVLIGVFICASHEGTAQPEQAQVISKSAIDLKEDFSASDFKLAVVGKWKSVFNADKTKRNIQNLEFTSDGTASLIITQADNSEQYSGSYTITFDREPGVGTVTVATIAINSNGSNPIVLSRVSFGLHNGIPLKEGIVLRIDREPYGVLKRQNKPDAGNSK
ncbi:MAG TPA: hypothetical protein DCZ94_09785 [Lentisphaeria bacterium]|nr:MAG: hypothetical protein A2X48_19025 [Lentisphaerae bacterium GWF2_49_21]HBC87233.1 hypothetical protein [Lentisphaeria bacterium]